MILIWQRKGVIWSLMMLPLIYVSVMVTIWGASRSALGISVGAALLLVYLINQNLTRAFGIVAFIAVISVFLMPKFVEGATRMQNKKEVKSLTDNSRGSLWMARVEEFTTSPLWGIGFSATGIGRSCRNRLRMAFYSVASWIVRSYISYSTCEACYTTFTLPS